MGGDGSGQGGLLAPRGGSEGTHFVAGVQTGVEAPGWSCGAGQRVVAAAPLRTLPPAQQPVPGTVEAALRGHAARIPSGQSSRFRPLSGRCPCLRCDVLLQVYYIYRSILLRVVRSNRAGPMDAQVVDVETRGQREDEEEPGYRAVTRRTHLPSSSPGKLSVGH